MNYFKVFIFSLFIGFISLNSLYSELTLDLEAGYRQDELNWNIAGFNGNPNVCSELSWEDLQIFQVQTKAFLTTSWGFYLRGNADYGWIYQGRNQDSDYEGSNRTQEYSRSNNKADDGNVYDAVLGLGRSCWVRREKLWIAPLFGYSAHGQHLTMTDGVQTIATDPSFLGPFAGLHSRYNALWYGPWVGLDFGYVASPRLSLWGNAEYHWAKYRGKGSWNLREDFIDDFIHDADGTGVVLGGGFNYCLRDQWFWGLSANYQNWQTDPGNHRVTALVNLLGPNKQIVGTLPIVINTRLNEVKWRSWSISFVMGYSW